MNVVLYITMIRMNVISNLNSVQVINKPCVSSSTMRLHSLLGLRGDGAKQLSLRDIVPKKTGSTRTRQASKIRHLPLNPQQKLTARRNFIFPMQWCCILMISSKNIFRPEITSQMAFTKLFFCEELLLFTQYTFI